MPSEVSFRKFSTCIGAKSGFISISTSTSIRVSVESTYDISKTTVLFNKTGFEDSSSVNAFHKPIPSGSMASVTTLKEVRNIIVATTMEKIPMGVGFPSLNIWKPLLMEIPFSSIIEANLFILRLVSLSFGLKSNAVL